MVADRHPEYSAVTGVGAGQAPSATFPTIFSHKAGFSSFDGSQINSGEGVKCRESTSIKFLLGIYTFYLSQNDIRILGPTVG